MGSSNQNNESTLDDRLYSLRPDTFSTSSSASTARRLKLETIKHVEEIKIGLFKVSEQINLLLLMIFVLMCYNWYLLGTQWLVNPYLFPEIKCDIKELRNATWSLQERRNITNPKNILYHPGCKHYNYDYKILATMPYEEAQEEIIKMKRPPIVECKKFTIIKDIPTEISFVKEFNIICQKPPIHLTNFCAEFGSIIFGFSGGLLADMYGRRPVHIYCAVILCAASFLTPLTTKYVLFATGKFITGGSLYLISAMLLLIYSEICLNKYRSFCTVAPYVWFVVGSGRPSAIYKIIEVWRLRNLAFACGTTIILFAAVMFIPESPRFLIIKGQFGKAWDCLEELGYQEVRPEYIRNQQISLSNFKYQMQILNEQYLQQRLYVALILNGVGVYFFHLFTKQLPTLRYSKKSLNFLMAVSVLPVSSSGLMIAIVKSGQKKLKYNDEPVSRIGLVNWPNERSEPPCRSYISFQIDSEYFVYYFVSGSMGTKRLSINETVEGNIMALEMVLIIFSAVMVAVCSKKTMICMFYILTALCFTTVMVSDAEIMKDVGILSGTIFADTLYIITMTYTIDIFPTTHRATSYGFCLSTNSALALLMKMFHSELSLNMESDYLNGFYCGLCMICALIVVISPETDLDLPDSKSDLYRKVSTDNSRRSSSDSNN